MNTIETKNAIIIEDFKLIAEVWQTILESQGITTLKIYDNADGVENEILELCPDIILMDINLKGKVNGIQLTSKLVKSNPNLRVLVLTIHKSESYILKAKKAGARGYITKNSSITELNLAIQTVLDEGFYFDSIYLN